MRARGVSRTALLTLVALASAAVCGSGPLLPEPAAPRAPEPPAEVASPPVAHVYPLAWFRGHAAAEARREAPPPRPGSCGAHVKEITSPVAMAFDWFRRHQSSDGRWDPADFSAQCESNHCFGAGTSGRDVPATALVLLAFLGAGETHQSGTVREQVKNGLKFLMDAQDAGGCFVSRNSPRLVLDHAIAACALTEAYRLTSSRKFRDPAQRGVQFALNLPEARLPWRAGFREDSPVDAPALAWMVLLLDSAKKAELEIDHDEMRNAAAWFDRHTDRETGRVSLPGSSPEASDLLTATGMVARVLAGRTAADDAMIAKGADLLAARVAAPETDEGETLYTCELITTLAMLHAGGPAWRRWNDAVRFAVLTEQRREPARDERGSWDPPRVHAEEGRVIATALHAMVMEIHYRYSRVIGSEGAPPEADPAASVTLPDEE